MGKFTFASSMVLLLALCGASLCSSAKATSPATAAATAVESESTRDANQPAIVTTVNAEIEAEPIAATAPADETSQDYQRHHQENHINQLDDDEPVRYDGAQVWRLGLSDTREKNAVADLQHNFGNFSILRLRFVF